MQGCVLEEERCTDVTNTHIDLITLDGHVDLRKDPQDVISYSMDASNSIVIDPRSKQNLDLFYSKSTVELDDSPLKVFNSFKKESEFFEFKKVVKF